MKVISIKDNTAPAFEEQRFREHFAEFEILLYEWEELIDVLYHRKVSGQFLFMPSIYHRISDPAGTYKFMVAGGFKVMYHQSDINMIGFDPSELVVEPHRFYYTGPRVNTFTVTGGIEYYPVKPIAEDIPILLYTHHRFEFFSLTLDSLLYSLNYDTSHSPIKVLISGPPEEAYKKTINKINGVMQKYPNLDIEVLLARNLYISSANALVQYFDAEKFIIMEDDVILPPLTAVRLPNWPLLFSQRLDNGFDVVGFMADTNNRLPDHVWPVYPHLNKQDGWYLAHKPFILPIMGHCVAFTRQKFRDGFVDKYNSPTDEKLMKSSDQHCSPWLRVYHIGWNQKMHDFGSPAPLSTEDVVDVVSLKTGLTKRIDLKGL